jgi:hypothetical protein
MHTLRPRLHQTPPWWKRALTATPDAIIVPLVWLSGVASLAVVTHQFRPWLVLPAAALLSAATWRWRPDAYVRRGGWWSALAAGVFIVAWVAANAPYASRWVQVSRDPGFLTLEGIWLSRHPSPDLDVSAAIRAAALIPGAHVGTPAYPQDGAVLHVQGAKLVSALAAMGGWAAGVDGVLVANVVIGALALIAVYAFARRLVGPVWSLVAIVALGLSMPFLAFTRSIYTEPLVVAVTFGGLVLLFSARQTMRWQHFVMAGAAIGVGGLARIDGAALVIGLVVGCVAFVVVAPPGQDRRALRGLYAAISAAIFATGLGLLDLIRDSPAYFENQWRQALPLLAATVVVIVLAVLITLPAPLGVVRSIYRSGARRFPWAVFALVIMTGVFLASRPLWYRAHGTSNPLVIALQNLAGLPVDGSRTYNEFTLNWVAMYFSWFVVAGGLLGLALALRRSLNARDGALFASAVIIAAPSALYLWVSSISPDQIWAMRRFLPVTIPGFIVFTVWLLAFLGDWALRRRVAVRVLTLSLVATVACATVAFPAWSTATSGVARAVQYGGQLGQAEAICRAVANRPVVLVGQSAFLPTLNTLCRVSVVELDGPATTAQLRAAKSAWPGRSPVVIAFGAEGLPWKAGAAPAPWSTTDITSWRLALNVRPHGVDLTQSPVWVAGIDAEGAAVPLAGA